MSSIGKELKKARKEAKLTQVQVFKETGITTTEQSNYENDRHVPSQKRLNDLASLYGKQWTKPKLINIMTLPPKTKQHLIDRLDWHLECGNVTAKSDYKGYSMQLSHDVEYNYSNVVIEVFKGSEPIEVDADEYEDMFTEKAIELQAQEDEDYKQENIYQDINMYN